MTMTQKEKLVELIAEGRMCPVDGNPFEEEGCLQCKYAKDKDCDLTRLADYLLKNGVIVPPCKVGDTVWVIRSQTSNGKNLYILEDRVKRMVTERQECLQTPWTRIEFENITSEFEWGFSNIFLTKEEAEKALAEKRTNNG